jgi:riboflavin synthase
MAACVFTGLVQTQGKLLGRSPRAAGVRLCFGHDLGPLELGESVAVDGVCLTVATNHPQRFEADASRETVSCTTLSELAVGRAVHLERALRVGDRLGGHIVAGHVDAIAQHLETQTEGDALELVFELPARLAAFIAEKGSIAVDGVSLTVNRVTNTTFSVMVVPHTQRSTHLGSLRRGNAVNLEVDVLARYVVHLARVGTGGTNPQETGEAAASSRDATLRKALERAGLL